MEGFDLTAVIEKLRVYSFERIVLQFPDEYLNICTNVYSEIVEAVEENCDVYIAADSTFGSSVDDISAAHVDSDLLIYFGSDMSASASIPVMVVPQQKRTDDAALVTMMYDTVGKISSTSESILFIYDPSYAHFVKREHSRLLEIFGAGNKNIGILPPCADISTWTPGTLITTSHNGMDVVGGLLFPAEVLACAQSVVYVGEKHEQLVSVLLRLSGCDVTAISPEADNVCTVHRGVDCREYRERYVGVLRVEEASIIGIIVGSMGLSDTIMNTLVNQLQALINAAGKKSYCFVMGRINEAKLCNFPEIDVFCLISNDDCSRIPAKTFHVPVVTPYELELGLGAREWDTSYITSASSTCVLIEEVADAQGSTLFEDMLERVKEKWARSRSSSEGQCTDDEYGHEQLPSSSKNTAVVTIKAKDQLTVFSSAAAVYFHEREYQGMDASVPEGHSVEIQAGAYGTATGYEHTNKLS